MLHPFDTLCPFVRGKKLFLDSDFCSLSRPSSCPVSLVRKVIGPVIYVALTKSSSLKAQSEAGRKQVGVDFSEGVRSSA